jgi:SAM-dependent methyltransferase
MRSQFVLTRPANPFCSTEQMLCSCLWTTFQRLYASVVHSPYRWVRNGITYLFFERRLGVRTSGGIGLHALGIEAEGRQWYQPVGWMKPRRILPPGAVMADDVFLDIGSGMGRAVLPAVDYPFRRVIGVELSRDLTDIAQDNVDRSKANLRCKDVDLVTADTVEYENPDDDTVVFMNNPIPGANFAAVVQHILESYDRNPRPPRKVYANPIEGAELLSTGRIQLIKRISEFRPVANGHVRTPSGSTPWTLRGRHRRRWRMGDATSM